MRVGILGGTFDPIHRGHLHLAREARRKLRLDKVLIIPAFIPPHKEARKGKIAPAAHRRRMIELALEGHPSFELCDWELRLRKKVYTVETLRALKRMYPRGAEFFLLTGADNIEILDHWRHLDQILRLCRFVIATRPPYKEKVLAKGFLRLPIRPVPISSTQVRRQAKLNKDLGRLVPAPVARYIRLHTLYRVDPPT